MKIYAALAVVVLALALAGGGYVHAQRQRLEAQQKTIAEQGEHIGQLEAANAAQAAVIDAFEAAKNRDEQLVLASVGKVDALTARIQSLDRKTQEALKNAPQLTINSFLPLGAANALCLQWHAASGYYPTDNQGNAPAGAFARAAHAPAAGAGTTSTRVDCRGWEKLTVAQAVEWNGLLLRHAGTEREDKAALREWAAGVTP